MLYNYKRVAKCSKNDARRKTHLICINLISPTLFHTVLVIGFDHYCITSIGSKNLETLIFSKTTFCQRGNTKRMAHILLNSRSSRTIRTPIKSINHASKYHIYENSIILVLI